MPADAPEIAEVHVRSWQKAYCHILPTEYLANLSIAERTQQWAERIADVHSTILAAVIDNRIVGWVSFGPARDKDATAKAMEVYALYVLAEHWSTGVGCALWLACKQAALSAGASVVSLWVISH